MGMVGLCRNFGLFVGGLMLFNFSHGSFAAVFGIGVFGKHSDAWWHRAFIWPIYRVGSRIRDGIWWIRYRIDPNHKYHLINTRLSPRYYDIDTLMLNGMFSLLRRYVEEEHGGVADLEKWGNELIAGGPQDFMRETEKRQGNKEIEAVTLYRWWMETLPSMRKRESELLSLLYGRRRRMVSEKIEGTELSRLHIHPDEGEEIEWRKELDALEEKIEREETEMLHRLIDIRGGLWT
jgi:hypothetical protein